MVKKECKWCAMGECWSHGQVENAGGKKTKAPQQAGVKKGNLKQNNQQNNQQQLFMQMAQQFMGNQGMQQLQQMMGGAQGGAQGGAGQGQGDQSKMLLSQFVQEKTGEQATKDAIVYCTEQVEGVNPPQFVSEVTLVTIDPDKSYKGQPSANKKTAEASAAAKALKGNGQKNKGGGKGPAKQAPKAAKKKKEGKEGKDRKCNWCEKGECWTHGQIEKPEKA